jgi:hypothetical protein
MQMITPSLLSNELDGPELRPQSSPDQKDVPGQGEKDKEGPIGVNFGYQYVATEIGFDRFVRSLEGKDGRDLSKHVKSISFLGAPGFGAKVNLTSLQMDMEAVGTLMQIASKNENVKISIGLGEGYEDFFGTRFDRSRLTTSINGEILFKLDALSSDRLKLSGAFVGELSTPTYKPKSGPRNEPGAKILFELRLNFSRAKKK